MNNHLKRMYKGTEAELCSESEAENFFCHKEASQWQRTEKLTAQRIVKYEVTRLAKKHLIEKIPLLHKAGRSRDVSEERRVLFWRRSPSAFYVLKNVLSDVPDG